LPPARSARPDLPESGPDDSEIVVHLFRSAYVAAFLIVAQGIPSFLRRPVTPALFFTVAIALVFTLSVLVPYLRPQVPLLISSRFRRPFALLLDVALNTCIMQWVGPVGRELFPVYYLIVFVGALWYRVPGALATAFCALVLHAGTVFADASDPHAGWVAMRHIALARAPFLLVVALIAGYGVRGRERERRLRFALERDLLAARRIQQQMLPASLPLIEGYEVAVRFQPSHTVGGDYYDWFALGDGRWAFCLADAAGKSLQALIELAGFRAHFLAGARRRNSPAVVARFVNELSLASLPPDSFVALFYAVLSPERGHICYTNCGHTPPFALHRAAADEPPERLSTGDIVLGVLRDAEFHERDVVLAPGDVLLCCTDGLVEARDEQGEMLGDQLVGDLLVELAEASAEEIADAILAAARGRSVRLGEDDLTVLILKRRRHV